MPLPNLPKLPANATATQIAIGDEVVSGQIANSNGAWISQKLFDLGIETIAHRAIRDREEAISACLAQALAEADHIFVTGGLGPTKDDVTRRALAQAMGTELIFDDSEWLRLQQLMQKRNVPCLEQQRRQCFFPRGATVLENSAGTASGFFMQSRGRCLWALPGPPIEVAAVWDQNIEPALSRDHSTVIDRRSWMCLDRTESQLAQVVDETVGQSDTLEVGFRLARPYVEVKATLRDRSGKGELDQLGEALGAWAVTSSDRDLADQWLSSIQGHAVVCDEVSQGYLPSRIGQTLHQRVEQNPDKDHPRIDFVGLANAPLTAASFHVAGDPMNGSYEIHARGGNGKKDLQFSGTTQFHGPNQRRRNRELFSEFALWHWTRWLSE